MRTSQLIILATLSGLVVLTVVAVLAANFGLLGPEAAQSPLARWGLAGVLGELVALYVLIGRLVFEKRREITVEIGPPRELPNLDISQIEWVKQDCFLETWEGTKVSIGLVPSQVGPSLRVELPTNVGNILATDKYVELMLKDKKGNTWQVKPFRTWETLRPLAICKPLEKIIRDYGESEE